MGGGACGPMAVGSGKHELLKGGRMRAQIGVAPDFDPLQPSRRAINTSTKRHGITSSLPDCANETKKTKKGEKKRTYWGQYGDKKEIRL